MLLGDIAHRGATLWPDRIAFTWGDGRRSYGELVRQNLPEARETGWAVVVGIAVFAIWIQLDAPWMQLGTATASFVPLDGAGQPIWTPSSCPSWRSCSGAAS